MVFPSEKCEEQSVSSMTIIVMLMHDIWIWCLKIVLRFISIRYHYTSRRHILQYQYPHLEKYLDSCERFSSSASIQPF